MQLHGHREMSAGDEDKAPGYLREDVMTALLQTI